MSLTIAGGSFSDIQNSCKSAALAGSYSLIDFRSDNCFFSSDGRSLKSSSVGCLVNTDSSISNLYAYASRGYVSIGCFDGSSLNALDPDFSYASDDKTRIDICSAEAQLNGYSVFALSGNTRCWGGNNLDLITQTSVQVGCSLVGQNNVFQVYANPSIVYSSIGCFQDSSLSSSSLSAFQISTGTTSYDANSCGTIALSQRNMVYGLKNFGSICFVGNETSSIFSSYYLPDCSSGGSKDISHIFVRTISEKLGDNTQFSYLNIGCFKDSSTRVLTFQSSNSNPLDCAKRSENSFQILFGMQLGSSGIDCYTGNSVSSAISLGSVKNCPVNGGSFSNQIFVRKFCYPGWTNSSSFTGNLLTMSCRACTAGNYCPGNNTELPCAIDFSTNNYTQQSECVPCDDGYSTIGLSGSAVCFQIPPGYFVRNNVLVFCGTDPLTQFYIGGGNSNTTCRCGKGYVGDHCDIPVCVSDLHELGGSLGTLLFNSDSILTRASNAFTSGNVDTVSTSTYLLRLLSIDIDVNGDGQLTSEEMMVYLTSRSIFSTGMDVLPLWCTIPTNCHLYMYPVNNLYREALNNFLTSQKHKFDGSGVEFIGNQSSTFPDPSWNDTMCRQHDSSITGSQFVQTSWIFTQVSGYTIRKVCGYVNGLLSPEFTTTDILTGKKKSFVDIKPISSDNQFKRVYCVFVYYTVSNTAHSNFECSTGLFYVRIG